jgi:hypothetical protein
VLQGGDDSAATRAVARTLPVQTGSTEIRKIHALDASGIYLFFRPPRLSF